MKAMAKSKSGSTQKTKSSKWDVAIQEMQQFAEVLETDVVPKKFVRRSFKIAGPTDVTAIDAKSAREALGLSQSLFAEWLGVGVALVRAWEGGTRSPKGADRRPLTHILNNPDLWRKEIAAAQIG
jgi:putative transcriptional regulator